MLTCKSIDCTFIISCCPMNKVNDMCEINIETTRTIPLQHIVIIKVQEGGVSHNQSNNSNW